MKAPSKECTANQHKEHNVEKYMQYVFMLLPVADNTGLSSVFFIRLAVVDSKIYEIPQNSPKIRTYSSSRSSKVIDLGVYRKLICNFLLVINSNYGHTSYRFPDLYLYIAEKYI